MGQAVGRPTGRAASLWGDWRLPGPLSGSCLYVFSHVPFSYSQEPFPGSRQGAVSPVRVFREQVRGRTPCWGGKTMKTRAWLKVSKAKAEENDVSLPKTFASGLWL